MTRTAPHTARDGFTLLEMMVVLGIITLLLAIGAPVYMQLTTLTTAGATADAVANTMRKAQAEAILSKRQVRFRYNHFMRLCYVIPESAPPNADSSDDFRVAGEEFIIGEPVDMPVGPMVCVGSATDEASFDITFQPDGSVLLDPEPTIHVRVVLPGDDGVADLDDPTTNIRIVPATGFIGVGE